MNLKAWLLVVFCVMLMPVIFVISPVLLAIAIFLGTMIVKWKFATIKGAVGEMYVNNKLSKLDPKVYRIYHDLYVPNGDGGTAQVDHVVTSPFGIIVIETKHYEGWIFGNERQRYWTQVIYKRKEKLFNPIWQNKGHIRALQDYLEKDDEDDFFSIIAFSQNSTLKFEDNFSSARVTQFPQLLNVMQEWNKPIIDESELEAINKELDNLIIRDSKKKREIKKKHVAAIKNNAEKSKHTGKVIDRKRVSKPSSSGNDSSPQPTSQESSEDSVNPNGTEPKCPKCNATLSLKKGKYGSFYGCSNFPKCRHTEKVS
ncbi:NERD domain-containing protein [Bacillus shivajii]|uniref:NERD domain-containing protein n=1 Tax=Bacillus shivajii TaxID=1983719 RepID=UPI001CFA0116|nr:NERD domain-containing protein [Bacillus shivajii]UCZ52895.1 NERD domain-containing protein [Bacillus shivajii]